MRALLFAAELNRRVSLEALSEAQDPSGQAVRKFTPVATVWASVVPHGGKDYFRDDKTTVESAVTVVIRYRTDVDETWRLRMDTRRGPRYFGIVNLSDTNDAHVELVLTCRELPLGEPV